MYLVLRMANSMSSRNRNYLGAAKRNVHAVDLLQEWSDRRLVENLGSGAKRKGAEPRPRPEQRYTELDVFRRTSSPSPAPSPNALFALLRCGLCRQPTV